MKKKPEKVAKQQQALQFTSQNLYDGLREMERTAVSFLYHKVTSHLAAKAQFGRITQPEVEELASDTVELTLRKIGDGSYTFEGHSPLSYALVVAENLFRNFCRRMRLNCHVLEDAEVPSLQPEVEAYLAQKELETHVERALCKLSKSCQLVIRLKYFDDLRDEEVLAQGLLPYRNADSLKSSRCRCLKRLAEVMEIP